MIALTQTNILQAAFFIIYYGLVYLFVQSILATADSKPSLSTSKPDDTEVPSGEPLSSVSEPVLQAHANSETDVQPASGTESEQESSLDLHHTSESYNPDECDYTPVPYRHELWPSPRPVNFVYAIMQHEPELKQFRRRLTHVHAVDILAQRASISRKKFLKTNPLTYSERYMKGINSLYLLKDSIDHLENMLRNELYKQELRRIENGRITCSY
jgi:hypothetical protein